MRIVPISQKTLEGAIALTLKCFPDSKPKDFDYPEKWLKYSLKHKDESKDSGFGYWAAVENGKVIGVTGLYPWPKDVAEANWLGWFCVDPKFRGKGIGSRMLELMIRKTRKSGKRFLRLYTTSKRGQDVARKLYEKRGFVETSRVKDKKKGGYLVYMELKV